MALKTIVKINRTNNLSDARYCAGMGVDLMGFCLDPNSPDVVSPEKFQEITGWIAGVQLVGEFYESSPLMIKELIGSYRLDYIQTSDPDSIVYLSQLELPIILLVTLPEDLEDERWKTMLEEKKSYVSYFLLTANEENAIDKYLPTIAELSRVYPFLLGFGVNADNALEIIEGTAIKGITLDGGHEIKSGYKDFHDLADVLEAIEIDDLD